MATYETTVEECVAAIKKADERLKYLRDELKFLQKYPERFTCFKCEARANCDLAFDGYNLDGDCLSK